LTAQEKAKLAEEELRKQVESGKANISEEGDQNKGV